MERDSSYGLSLGKELLDKVGNVLPPGRHEMREADVRWHCSSLRVVPKSRLRKLWSLERLEHPSGVNSLIIPEKSTVLVDVGLDVGGTVALWRRLYYTGALVGDCPALSYSECSCWGTENER